MKTENIKLKKSIECCMCERFALYQYLPTKRYYCNRHFKDLQKLITPLKIPEY